MTSLYVFRGRLRTLHSFLRGSSHPDFADATDDLE